jgi:hypothetical protein
VNLGVSFISWTNTGKKAWSSEKLQTNSASLDVIGPKFQVPTSRPGNLSAYYSHFFLAPGFVSPTGKSVGSASGFSVGLWPAVFSPSRFLHFSYTDRQEQRWVTRRETSYDKRRKPTGSRGHVTVDAQNRLKLGRRRSCRSLVPAVGAQREREKDRQNIQRSTVHVGTWQ